MIFCTLVAMAAEVCVQFGCKDVPEDLKTSILNLCVETPSRSAKTTRKHRCLYYNSYQQQNHSYEVERRILS